MGPILASLLRLQEIEHDMTHVRRRLRSKENAIRVVQRKIDELAERRGELAEQLRQQQSRIDQVDLDRASREEEIQQLRGALNRAKTNKEYAALLTQINSFKADNAKLEEQILGIMEGLDTAKVELEAIDAHIEAEEKRKAQAAEVNAEEVAKLQAMLEELEQRRNEAAADVPDDVLQNFDRIAENRDGEGLAPIEVVDANRNEFICGGCYMGLSVEHYNALLSKDEIRHCDSCGRILYIPAEARSQG
ncbi:MAG: zinc ribbon domain-containing protein [Planctomycetota bacterium]